MSSTKENRQAVYATYCSPDSVFIIPEGIDLRDKTVVKEWYVKWDRLHIEFVNGKTQIINPEYDNSDMLKTPIDCEIQDYSDDK